MPKADEGDYAQVLSEGATTLRKTKDPAPSLPLIGSKANLEPASGLVMVRPGLLGRSGMSDAARLVSGPGFRPLTEARQLPVDSQIDARAGALRLVLAGPNRRPTQQVTLAGGLFSLAQSTQAPTRGETTVSLVQDAFPGAPAYRGCAANPSAVLQTVQARNQRGSFATTSRDSSATASAAGTAWDTIVHCDGTVTVVSGDHHRLRFPATPVSHYPRRPALPGARSLSAPISRGPPIVNVMVIETTTAICEENQHG